MFCVERRTNLNGLVIEEARNAISRCESIKISQSGKSSLYENFGLIEYSYETF